MNYRIELAKDGVEQTEVLLSGGGLFDEEATVKIDDRKTNAKR